LIDLWLADLVVLVHLAYAGFVLFGFLAILVGPARRWAWTRNLRFRVIHLFCTVLVGVESVLGATCPLTTLENDLLQRGGKAGYERSFVGKLMNEVLFYDASERVFTVAYVALSLCTLLSFVQILRKTPLSRLGKFRSTP
jgi:Protein of Unknown function (DUF2784)